MLNFKGKCSLRRSLASKCPLFTAWFLPFAILFAVEDDLHDVISAVADLAGRWQEFGIALKLRISDLNAIHSTSAQSTNVCLRKMLTLWLRQNYNVCITLIYLVLNVWSVHWATILPKPI